MRNSEMSQAEIAALFQNVSELAERVARPANAEIESTGRIPAEVWQAAADLGLFKLMIPRKFGGLGANMETSVRVIEILSQACLPLGVNVAVGGSTVQPMLLAGNEDQQRRVFARLAERHGVACGSFTERMAGSDLRSMAARATRVDGGYVLNGGKMFAFLGGIAEVFAIWAQTDEGVTSFLVWPESEGFSVSDELPRMGLRGVSLVELGMENVFVPDTDVLGVKGKGLSFGLWTINKARVDVGAQCVGMAQAALDYAIGYLMKRQQFGRPVIDFQAVQLRLANMSIQLEGVRLMVERAARAMDSGDPKTIRYCAEVKVAGSEMAVKVTSEALMLLGGHGYLKEHPLERIARDATAYRLLDGTNDMNRLRVATELIKEAKGRPSGPGNS